VKVHIYQANIEDLKKLLPNRADNLEDLVNFVLGSWIFLEREFRKSHSEKFPESTCPYCEPGKLCKKHLGGLI